MVVIGYLLATGVAVAAVWMIAGRGYTNVRDRSVDLGELGGRNVGVLGGLAGFAITAIVLLVTLGRGLPVASDTPFTALLTMFFVAYVAALGASLVFASITDDRSESGFDLPAAGFVVGAMSLSFGFAASGLALQPMFEAFGLFRMAEIAGWVMVVAVIAGYGLIVQYLHRAGYVNARLAVAIGLLALAASGIYAAVAALFRLTSPESTLLLTVTGFAVAAPAYVLIGSLPVIARSPRVAGVLARRGPYVVLAYVQSQTMLLSFLVLCVLGLA